MWRGHSLFDYIRLEMPIRYPNRDVETVSYVILDLKGEIRARDENTDTISI